MIVVCNWINSVGISAPRLRIPDSAGGTLTSHLQSTSSSPHSSSTRPIDPALHHLVAKATWFFSSHRGTSPRTPLSCQARTLKTAPMAGRGKRPRGNSPSELRSPFTYPHHLLELFIFLRPFFLAPQLSSQPGNLEDLCDMPYLYRHLREPRLFSLFILCASCCAPSTILFYG